MIVLFSLAVRPASCVPVLQPSFLELGKQHTESENAFVGSWVEAATSVAQQALAQLSRPPPAWRSEHAGRPTAAGLSEMGGFFSRAFRVIGGMMTGSAAQVDMAMRDRNLDGLRKPPHGDEDSMLGGLMGYTNGYAFGLDEPGWRTDPFAQPMVGATNDECAYTLNRWLSRCEWSHSSYLQLLLEQHRRGGEAARFHEATGGSRDEARRLRRWAEEEEQQQQQQSTRDRGRGRRHQRPRPWPPSVQGPRPLAPQEEAGPASVDAALTERLRGGEEMLRGLKDATGREISATPRQRALQAQLYGDALRDYRVSPPLDKRIWLPEGLKSAQAWQGSSANTVDGRQRLKTQGMITGPRWDSAEMVPRHVAESESTWSLPRQRRAGFGREAHLAVSTEAETCYQQMNAWLGKCVMSPM